MTVKELGELLLNIEEDILECELRKTSIADKLYTLEKLLRKEGIDGPTIDTLLTGMKTRYPDYFKD